MDLLQLLTRRPAKSVMEPDYVGETDASQPVRGLLKALMERSVDVPAAAINQSMPAALVRALTGARMPVPSEQTPAAMGGGAGYEFGRSLPDTVVSALLLANPAASAARRAPANQVGAIKVYHGSPHKFDKFDSSKIGTGEGAQAYGHGGYFAEAPGVAKSYATKLAEKGKDWKTAKDITDSLVRGDAGRIEFLEKKGTWKPEEFAAMRAIATDPAYTSASGPQREQLFWNLWDSKTRVGNLYEASLRWPDPVREARDPLGPQHFLDWDKPMSAQPQSVKDAMVAAMKADGWQQEQIDRMLKAGSGQQGIGYIGPKGKAESRAFEAGLPGITYLDAGSRASGAGTRNYVTFSDDLIELLKRNGLPLKP